MIVGRGFNFEYEPSTLYIRDTSAGVSKAELGGRLQIRRVTFNHSNTGAYNVTVKQIGRDDRTYTFSGKTLATESAAIGANVLSNGRFSVPVMGRNEEVRIIVNSDLPVPLCLLTMDWEGFFTKRSRTV